MNFKDMIITYLHQYFNTTEMPGGTRSFEFSKRLVRSGHTINMITSWRGGDRKAPWYSNESGIHVYWLPVPYSNTLGFYGRIRSFFRFAVQAAQKAASLDADVVIATSTPLTIILPALWASRKRKVPIVFEVRDLWPDLPIAIKALRNPVMIWFARLLEKVAYRRSAAIIALSPGMKEGITAKGYPEHKIRVIPNSADLELFNPTDLDGAVFRGDHPEIGSNTLVVYSGTIGQINGVDYLPRIAAECQELDPSLQFAVLGEGKEEEKVRSIAAQLGVLGQNFHLYPPVPKSEMPKVLAAADLAVSLFIDLKAMWANSANKFFDALASGTPVAINYGGWQANLLTQTGAGIVLPPNDPQESARKLVRFLADKEGLRVSGRAARKLAEERFSRDMLALEFEQVLKTTIQDASA